MTEFKQAKPEEAKALALVSWRAFDHDVNYGAPAVGGPPGYKSDRWQRKMMQVGHYYTILVDSRIVGGIIVFDQGAGRFELGRIFVEPNAPNGSIFVVEV